MKEKIIFYIKKAYRPFVRSLILLGNLRSRIVYKDKTLTLLVE